MIPDLKPKNEIHLRLTENDVRPSCFLEFLRDNLIAIEQTKPAIDHSRLMSIIFLTYRPDAGKEKRMGFEARIETITPDHRIFLRQMSDPFFCDLRQWRRVRRDVMHEGRAFYQNHEIQIIDISGGGARLAWHEEDYDAPSPGTLIAIKFIFAKGEILMEGEVLHQGTGSTGKRHISVKFVNPQDVRKMIY